MGLFSSIGKIFKKVTKGITKVFKKVTKFVGKVVRSKWFKYVMIAAAVVTVGIALYAGVTAGMAASAQGATLMDAFVAGSKEFMTALIHPITTAKSAFAGELSVSSRIAQAGQAAITGPGVTTAGLGSAPASTTTDLMAGEVGGETVSGLTEVTSAIPAPAAATPAASVPVATVPTATPPVVPPPAEPGILGKVGGFLSTTGGGMLMAGALQGYGAGKIAEEGLKEKHRIEGMWNDPTQTQAAMDASSQPVTVPESAQWWNAQGAVAAPWQIRKMYGYPPTVPFTG